MTRKQEIIVAIRDGVLGIINGALSLLRIMVLSGSPSRVQLPHEGPSEVVILGNGPSLRGFLEQHLGFLEGKASICVNLFAMSEEYEKIRPEVYVISAPEFFLDDQFEMFDKRRKEGLRVIASKTSWPMTLYVPMMAKRLKKWKKSFKGNSHITFAYFNNTPVEGSAVTLWAMRRQLGMPRPHNVLIPCISLSIYLGFKRLYLTGVEHSWLNEIVVNEDNEVLVTQKHFYDKHKEQLQRGVKSELTQPMFKGIKLEKRRLHEVIEKFYLSFRSYWELKPYAEDQGVVIINVTPDSYIDAFDKKSVQSIMSEDKTA
ncbi:MAG: hypothetical protein AAGA85_06990 [Bacteroidota bacterium]